MEQGLGEGSHVIKAHKVRCLHNGADLGPHQAPCPNSTSWPQIAPMIPPAFWSSSRLHSLHGTNLSKNIKESNEITASASLECSLQRAWLRSDSSESGISVTHSMGSEEHGKCNLPVSQLVQSIKTGKFNLSKNVGETRVCGDSM